MGKQLQIYRHSQRRDTRHRMMLLGAWWGQCISTALSSALWGLWRQVCHERGRRGAQGLCAGDNHCAGYAEVSFCRDTHTSPCHGLHLWSLSVNGSNMWHIDKKIRSDIAQGICIVYSENAHFKNPIRLILPLGYRQ